MIAVLALIGLLAQEEEAQLRGWEAEFRAWLAAG